MIPSFGPVAGQMVGDASTHEHDIRDALGAPGARDSDAVHIGSHWMAHHMGRFHRDAGHGTLRIETDLWSETFGDEPPDDDAAGRARSRCCGPPPAGAAPPRSPRSTGTAPPHPEIVVMPIFVPRAEDFDG